MLSKHAWPMGVASHLYDFYFCKRVYSRVRFSGLLVCRRRRRRRPLFYCNYALLSLCRKEPKVRHNVVRGAYPCNGTICAQHDFYSRLYIRCISELTPEHSSFYFRRRKKESHVRCAPATHEMDVDWKWCGSYLVHCALGTLDGGWWETRITNNNDTCRTELSPFSTTSATYCCRCCCCCCCPRSILRATLKAEYIRFSATFNSWWMRCACMKHAVWQFECIKLPFYMFFIHLQCQRPCSGQAKRKFIQNSCRLGMKAKMKFVQYGPKWLLTNCISRLRTEKWPDFLQEGSILSLRF